MPKITDEELDRLFREAAESTHPEFDPGDWDDMSRKLVREEKAAKGRNRTLYSVVTLLVLYSLWSPFGDRKLQTASMNLLDISEFSVKDAPRKSETPELLEESEVSDQSWKKVEQNDTSLSIPKLTEQNVKSAVRPETTGAISMKDQRSALKIKDKTSSRRKNISVVDSDLNKKSAAGVVKNPTEVVATDASVVESGDHTASPVDENVEDLKSKEQNEINTLSAENSTKEKVVGRENRTLPTVNNEVVQINKGAELSASEIEKDVDNGGFKSLPAKSVSVDREDVGQTEALHEFPTLGITRDRKLPLLFESDNKKKTITAVTVERPAPTLGETVVKKDALQSGHPWYIKLPVSPDFSSIDYGSTGKTGINIGLIGEYYLTKHISLSTGAIWSKKLYDQNNPDKVYSSGSWSAKVLKLDGVCRVLDIPLNATYYLFPERRTNFFVTVGTSSYIMLNEDYEYTVWKNQGYMTYDQRISNKNNEWFSMLNVSIGIQQRVGQRFLFQVEPFLKAPMSGVGEGKVNLVSTGAFVSLKYQLTK